MRCAKKCFFIYFWRRQFSGMPAPEHASYRGRLGSRSCPRSTTASHSVSVNCSHNLPLERRTLHRWAIAAPARSSSPMPRCQENVMCSWGVVEKPTIREKGLS